MTLDEYQQECFDKSVFPEFKGDLTYYLLALAGEVGELCNKRKKLLRAGKMPGAEELSMLADELGDVLWYVAAVARSLDYRLSEVAEMNLDKIESRRISRQMEQLKTGGAA